MVKSANSNVKIVKLMLRNSPFFYPKLIISAVAERQLIVKTDYTRVILPITADTLTRPFPTQPPARPKATKNQPKFSHYITSVTLPGWLYCQTELI